MKVYFTARDPKNPVTTLSVEDLLLLEDGVPKRVMALEGPDEIAVNLTLLIDVSGSHEDKIPTVRKAALSLVNSAVRPGKDTALVATFTDAVKLEQGATADLQKLQTAIQSLKSWQQHLTSSDPPVVGNQSTRGPRTAIWDAVWTTCESILPQTDQRMRQVIVIFTDGDDLASQRTTTEVAAGAMRSNAAVYVVRIRKETVSSANLLVETAQRNMQLDGALAELTKPTGGRVYSVKDEKGLEAAIAQVVSEVHGQFSVKYTPTKQGRKGQYRKLEIKTTGRSAVKMNIAHQAGYYVSAQ